MPHRWLATVRHSLGGLSAFLSADRMVAEYVERLYRPAALAYRAVTAAGLQPARELAEWKSRVRAAWPGVAVVHVESGGVDAVPQVGESLHVRARVATGGLAPQDLAVEIVSGRVGADDAIDDSRHQRLELDPGAPAEPGAGDDGTLVYAGTVLLDRPGGFGYTVRITPANPLLASPAEMGLVATAS